jgi:hypothetical protein
MNVTRVADGMDGSLQYELSGFYWRVDACIEKGVIICHTWFAEGQGRTALAEIEKYAKRHGLKVAVSTVISGALEKILRDNGYAPHDEEFEVGGDKGSTDIWEKDVTPPKASVTVGQPATGFRAAAGKGVKQPQGKVTG